jgi:Rhodopirellula transposase DDE domain
LEIKLVYYPPYHSKYNLIERCWGILVSPGALKPATHGRFKTSHRSWG